MCAASMPLADLPHFFWVFLWWHGPHLSLILNYLTIILRFRFPWQTLMATKSKPVHHNCNCCQYFPSLASFLPEVSFSPAMLFSQLCQARKNYLHVIVSVCLCHWRILSLIPCPTETSQPCCMPRLTCSSRWQSCWTAVWGLFLGEQ